MSLNMCDITDEISSNHENTKAKVVQKFRNEIPTGYVGEDMRVHSENLYKIL